MNYLDILSLSIVGAMIYIAFLVERRLERVKRSNLAINKKNAFIDRVLKVRIWIRHPCLNEEIRERFLVIVAELFGMSEKEPDSLSAEIERLDKLLSQLLVKIYDIVSLNCPDVEAEVDSMFGYLRSLYNNNLLSPEAKILFEKAEEKHLGLEHGKTNLLDLHMIHVDLQEVQKGVKVTEVDLASL